MTRDADLDALRRRVYGPDATAEDVDRYAAALVPQEPVAPAPPPVAVLRPGRPRTLRLGGLVVAALVAALVAAVGAAVAQHAPPRPAVPSPAAIVVPPATRTRFVEDLRAGRATGLGVYLIAHPDVLPQPLRTVRDPEVHQLSGVGSGGVQLRPSLAADAGGRLTVVVVADDDGPVVWSATRDIRDVGGLSRLRTVGRSAGTLTAGVPASSTVDYRAGAPTRVRLDLPEGVRWSAVVVLSE